MSRSRKDPVKVVIINTEYVETDATSFKSVVQRLTGKDSPSPVTSPNNMRSSHGGHRGVVKSPILKKGMSFRDLDKLLLDEASEARSKDKGNVPVIDADSQNANQHIDEHIDERVTNHVDEQKEKKAIKIICVGSSFLRRRLELIEHDYTSYFYNETEDGEEKKYVVEILERTKANYNPSRTPIDTESKLGSDGDPVSDSTIYRSLVGSLQYLTFTRLDISYAVQQVCLYMHDPREPYFSALKRILRYVRGTLDYGLQLFSSSTTDLVAYSNAYWDGSPTTRCSTSGYCVFLGNNLLSKSSKRQLTLSCSSAEAKYRGVTNVVAETCWLRNLLRELHTPLSSDTLVYCDNVRAVYLSCNLRTKHIEIDIHFVRDLVAAGQV
nr:ribonuclease H-like domain-containing protein [Tanacetum cinerariifolium]